MNTTAPRRRRLALALSIALPLAASPAAAQMAAPAYTSSKTEAILGGPSRLAALVAAQSGQPLAVRAATPIPASVGRLSYRPISPLRQPIASDRPDVFGSVALRVSHTPLDWRWQRVAHAAVGGGAAAFAASLRGQEALERVVAVNRYVNARVRYMDDLKQFGTADRWLAAGETLARGRGDCEDYAIAKLQMLRAAGIADRDLYLVIARDLVRRADHALLVVRAEGRLLLLDNNTDRIGDAAQPQDYRPIMTFAEGGAWIHGYRAMPSPVEMAEAAVPAPAGAPLTGGRD